MKKLFGIRPQIASRLLVVGKSFDFLIQISATRKGVEFGQVLVVIVRDRKNPEEFEAMPLLLPRSAFCSDASLKPANLYSFRGKCAGRDRVYAELEPSYIQKSDVGL